MSTRRLITLGIASLLWLVAASIANATGPPFGESPNWIYKGVEVSDDDPDIKHYSWEVARPPYGPYDMIKLHRYVREPYNPAAIPGFPAPDRRKVLFIIGGTWDSGHPYKLTSNTEVHYYAEHGYDVYSVDFRTSYVPSVAYEQFAELGEDEGLMSTGVWTYGAFREDIRAAVRLAKKLSRARDGKLFLAGRSRGGTQMYIYAAKYWTKDLKGLIGLDGGAIYRRAEDPALQQPEEAFLNALAAFQAGADGPFLSEVTDYPRYQFGGVQPYAETAVGGPIPSAAELPFGPPPDGSAVVNMLDWNAYLTYFLGFPGIVSNVFTPYPGGSGETFMDKFVLTNVLATLTRWWPAVQDLETAFLAGYANCPFLDYDDTEDVNVPIIHFAGELSCFGGSCLSSTEPYATATSDITILYLPGYGHLDVYDGTHAIEDVREPLLEWMEAHK